MGDLGHGTGGKQSTGQVERPCMGDGYGVLIEPLF